jgi:hypothetical protein
VGELWVEIPRWDDFQHYKTRRPPWIKNYTRLMHDPDYLDLSLAERGLLHSLWLLYAEYDGVLSASRAQRLAVLKPHYRHFYAHLDSLNDAGFVRLVDSKPLRLEVRDRDI